MVHLWENRTGHSPAGAPGKQRKVKKGKKERREKGKKTKKGKGKKTKKGRES